MDDLISDFIAETREGLEALDSGLVQFERNPTDPDLLSSVFRLIHTIKGTCGFLGLTRLQTVAHAAENVLGAFRDGDLAVTPGAVSAILDTVDLIRFLIEALGAGGVEPQGDDSPLIARLEAVLAGGAAALEPAPDDAPAEDRRSLIDRLGGDATLDAACEMVLDTLQGPDFGALFQAADRDLLQAALRDSLSDTARGSGGRDALLERLAACAAEPPSETQADTVLDHIARALGVLDIAPEPIADLRALLPASAVVAAAAPAPLPAETPIATAPPAAVAAEGEAVAVAQTIRVSVDALEHLMTVVSELVLIRNQLIQTLRLDPESPFAAPLNRLNQVTSELQEGVMTTRMQPISGAWAKLPRLVRDLATDLGKKIDLVTSGQETELDRQVLELIKDPLTHMIRNAADHGLETPAERLAAGKPETGRITLTARHEGGAIVIEVADDGRGLPAARIRAKALASGLASAAQIEAMSDAEVRHFIFAAGFSTAGEVTSVSGRGVGMDVVRTNIEKIGGAIELSSVEGQGSRFTIRIPLTLTIISALIVECCGERFAMPQSSVVELVSASDASGRNIEYIDGSAVLRLRDRLLPLVSLQSLLELDPEQVARGETCIVVARVGGFTFGVIVDRVFDTEEIVVKPVATVLRGLKLYSGATILGDGSVILILDFKGIAQETGAGQSDNSVQPDDAAAAAVKDERSTILIFRPEDESLKVVPLANVSRIEEIAAGQLERVDGRTVIQYRGQLMPVVGSDAAPAAAWDGEDLRPLLVFARDDHAMGLLVREIVDVVETSTALSLAAAEPGSLGSLIIGEKAAELIDVPYYWRAALGTQGRRADAAREAPDRRKRLLMIDDSPFCQMLLQPLLREAGYDVTVARDADAALSMHSAGEVFDLILADTPRALDARRAMAATLMQADAWRATPVVGLGIRRLDEDPDAFDGAEVLQTVSATLTEMRGAA